MKNSVAVILPTYNRPECIENLCNESFLTLAGTNFHVYILDSSTNEETENLIKQFNEKSEININYDRYDSNKGLDEKTILGLAKVSEEYIYILGDGNIIDFQSLYNDLFISNHLEFAFVDIENANRLGRFNQDSIYELHHVYICDDTQNYISKYFSHLTYWGASIVRTDLLKRTLEESLNKYAFDKITWWLPCLLVECLGMTDLKPGVLYTSAVTFNKGKTSKFWDKGEGYYKIVFEIFNKDISRLPQWVTPDTKYKLTKFFRMDLLVADDYLIAKRIEGTINLKLTLKYKKEIKYIDGYYWKILLLSLMPRIFVRFMSLSKRGIRRVVRLVREGK